jgi:hypothetical protein
MGKDEDLIGRKHKLGYKSFISIKEEVLMRWICKIFYGILYKELFYKLDPKNPLKGNIINPEQLKNFEFIYLLLQSYKFPIKFSFKKPYSLFIVNTYEYGDWRDFDYTDNYVLRIFSIRIGHTGIIMVFEDSESQKDFTEDYFKQYISGNILHPLQFDELYLKVAYTSARMVKDPFYVIKLPSADDKTIEIVAYPIRDPFSPWETKTYARFLWRHLTFKGWQKNINFEEFYIPERGVINFIEGPDDKFYKMKKDDEYLVRMRIRLVNWLNLIKDIKQNPLIKNPQSSW